MKKLKFNWTILHSWAKGQQQEAIEMLMGQGIPETEAMVEGKEIHKEIATKGYPMLRRKDGTPLFSDRFIDEDMDPENGKFRNYFSVKVMDIPVEHRSADYDARKDGVYLGGVIDRVDFETASLADWKSGTSHISSHSDMQLWIYQWLIYNAEAWKIQKEPAYGPYIKDWFSKYRFMRKAYLAKVYKDPSGAILVGDMRVCKLNKNTLALAEDYIQMNIQEIVGYLIEHKNNL